jgi:DNA-binding NarL/FixJ family response regulator
MPRSTNSARGLGRKLHLGPERRSSPTHADRVRINAEPAREVTRSIPAIGPIAEVDPQIHAGCHSLAASIEDARQAIEANTRRLSVEFVGLQLKAIDSIHESALLTLQLAEAVAQASGPARAAGVFFDRGRRQAVALNGVAFDFVRSALNLISALSPSGAQPAAFDRPLAIDRAEDARETLARRLAGLTSQQRKVLGLILAGLPNKLIAHELGICETTVKAHVSQVLQKLNVYSRARIIALVGRYGDIESLD